ncbi:Penicillopepsin [Dactylellina cionopaga]|nr:Penicillopepsin [Dactylellina cionopaga]
MHYKTITLILSVSAVFGAPLEVNEDTTSFSIPVIPNPDFELDGFHELRKTFLKYKRHFSDLVIPPGLLNYTKPSRLDRRGARIGSVSATPISSDLMYLSPVTIGKQTLKMGFDTGSSDLWVFSNQLPAAVRASHKAAGGTIYTPSSTAKTASGLTWSITYADDSSASGTVVTDSVKIGGITVSNQAVEMATSVSKAYEDFGADGLLGLAFGSINQDLKKKATGSYTWGYISSIYSRSVKYTKLRPSGWWYVDASGGIKINGKSYTSGMGNTLGAVPDTGSTLIILSDAVVKTYYSQVPGAQYRSNMGGWVYPCTSDSSSSMPSLTVPVGTTSITIPGKYMTYAYADSAGTSCFGGLQSLGSRDLPWIYGDVFFKGAYTVFDYGNKRFGVAQKS